MRILGKILKGCLWVLLILVLLCLLTVLSWWMEWPLITGAVILAGLFGLVLALYALRALWRWRDKRRFVSKVLDEQNRQEEQAREGAGRGRLSEPWNEGMDFLKRSPLRFQERVQYGRPWFVVVDAAGAADALLAPFGASLPEGPGAGASPLVWHFLGSSVLLRCRPATDEASRQDWEDLLTLLARNRRRIPLKGMIALLDAATLLELDNEALRDLGLALRAQTQQLMLTQNRRHPLLILVQGVEALPGMAEVLALAGPDVLDGLLGLRLDADAGEEAGREAAAAAVSRLEAAIRAAAAEGAPPKGDMLRALDALRLLGGRLQTTLHHLCRDIAHQARPRVRGLFFCEARRPTAADGKDALARPRFLAEPLGSVLPGLPRPTGLSGGLPFVASTRALMMAAWLTLLFCVCGLFAVNALYQRHVLSLEAEPTTDVSHDATINELYRRMRHAQRLEKAHRAWPLPTFGQDMLGRVEAEVKRRFVRDVNSRILAPLLSGFHARLAGSGRPDHDAALDIVRELVWLCDAVSDRILLGHVPDTGKSPFPLTRAGQNLWTPVTGELLANALNWIEDGGQLEALAQDMQGLLSLTLARKDVHLLESFLTNVDRRLPAAEICLSDFWSHIALSDEIDVCMPPAYTAAGHKAIEATLEDIESIARESASVAQRLKIFRDEYHRDYANRWRQFIEAFDKAPKTLTQGDVFGAYAEVRRIQDVPQVRLFQRLATELAPLERPDVPAPPWISHFALRTMVVNLAFAAHEGRAKTRLQSLFAVAATNPAVLRNLLDSTRSPGELRDLFRAADNLRTFFNNYADLLRIMANPPRSLDLAKLHYGGPSASLWVPAGVEKTAAAAGAPKSPEEEDLYTVNEQLLTQARRLLAMEGFSPLDAMLSGMLDFIALGCTVQASRVLQHAWENEVLSSPTALFRPDNMEAIFGDKGLVRTFADAWLKPFLVRQDQLPAAARWDELTFPFTSDFLALLGHSELVSASPPQDTFYVQLRSLPTLVNPDARERPDATELRLHCQDRVATLVNRNYPKDERFQYDIKQCGRTELSIRFPSFTLDRNYKSFVEFLQEFQDGKKEFTAADFPAAGERFAQAGLKTVTARILPDNVIGLFKQERTSGAAPRLPDRITYTW